MVDDLLGQGRKRLVGRGKHGERAGALERRDQAASLDGRHQRRQVRHAGSQLHNVRQLEEEEDDDDDDDDDDEEGEEEEKAEEEEEEEEEEEVEEEEQKKDK